MEGECSYFITGSILPSISSKKEDLPHSIELLLGEGGERECQREREREWQWERVGEGVGESGRGREWE